jgi:hypothetical protein
MRPSVNISVLNGGLGILAPSEFGTTVLMVASPAAPTAGYGVAFLIRSKADGAAAFANVLNADVLKAITEAFYGEAPEGTKLYVVCMAAATSLATLAAAANIEKALNMATDINGIPGTARLVALVKQPANTYVPVITDGFDQDVHDAVAAAQTIATTWLGKKKPFRFFIQGFAYSGTAADALDYSTAVFSNGGIVVGNVLTNDAAGTMFLTLLALGRAARVNPQQNIGRVKSGSLNIASSYAVRIGATSVDTISDNELNTLYTKRYITLEKNQIASGYVFSDDNALTKVTDDFNSISNGRVMDNAVRVAFATYYKELKDDVEVDAGGRLAAVVEKSLETAIQTQIAQDMKGQLSTKDDGTADVTCMVNPDDAQFLALYQANNIANPNFNVFSGGNVYIFISLRPKGCLKQINIFLGFTA